jgi:purine nucleoside phosphorylase
MSALCEVRWYDSGPGHHVNVTQQVDVFSWRTSTYSQANGECVEIAPTAAMDTLIRDSLDRAADTIQASSRAWTALLHGIQG